MTRHLYFRNLSTGEKAGHVDVTGKPESMIDRIERGMLINIGDDWCVCDTATEDESRQFEDGQP